MEKEGKITMIDMMVQVIQGDQLSSDEEAKLMEVLKERVEEREKKRRNRCLAGVIEQELEKKVEDGIIKESTKNRYHPIFRRCFEETTTGNLDASELSESVIREFIMEAHEFLGLNANDMYFFMAMLQMGLNKLSDMSILAFNPDRKMFRGYIESDRGIRYIDNPYSPEETKNIIDWVESHFSDARGLAVALWLSSNISPEEIVSLKRSDCWGNDNDFEKGKGIFKENVRLRLVSKAFKLHPENDRYVFMVKKDGGWRKLNERSLQIKLYYICQDIGIKYRAFHKNETIIPDR